MNGEVADILKVSQESLDKVIEGAKRDFSTIRTGRANPAILERVQVECYGSRHRSNRRRYFRTGTAVAGGSAWISPSSTTGKAIQKADWV